MQLGYTVITNGQRLNARSLKKLGINHNELYYSAELPGYPSMPLTAEMLESVKGMAGVVSVEPNLETENADYREIFPFSPIYSWTRDFFGPLWIPKAGATVELTEENLPALKAWAIGRLIYLQAGLLLHDGRQQTQFPRLPVLGFRPRGPHSRTACSHLALNG